MKIDQAGLDFIVQFEGLKLTPYLDSIKKPTIGVGTIHYPDGTPVKMTDKPITKEQALFYLQDHITKNVSPYLDKTFTNLTQNQYNALCSFVYNLGSGALDKSSLKKLILSNGTKDQIKAAFLKWDIAGGKVIQGLLSRRNKEATLFNL